MNSSHKEILQYCFDNGNSSIASFSKALRTSVPTATKLVQELIAEGYLQDEGKIGTNGGRKPATYGLNPGAGFFLGIDVARQHFHIAISDFRGALISYTQDLEFVLEAKPESFSAMCALVKKQVAQAGISWEMVKGICISLSGRVNPEKGFSLTYFFSEDIPLKDMFEQGFGMPVLIENDSRAMAYGEYKNMGDKANPNMLFINLSWGLGMGIIVNGELYYGTSGFSGEIGHFPILDNDMICRCGKVGCLETGASGSALKRWILEKIEEGRQSSLRKVLEANGDIRLNNILKAVEDGDVLAIEGIGEIGETLGRAIAGLINVFNPGLVVIGGRLIVGRDYLMLPIKTAVNRHSLTKVSADTKLRFSVLERKAASVGDCLLSRKKFISQL